MYIQTLLFDEIFFKTLYIIEELIWKEVKII